MENETKNHRSAVSEDQRVHFRLWLQRQFTERCKRNSRYSLRAFAKNLGMDHSSLSQILSGKRSLSKKSTQILCTKLSANSKELQLFGLAEQDSAADEYFQIEADSFAIMAEWYHAAIMEMTYTQGFKSDAKWMARKLSITTEEVKAAVERLKRLNLLELQDGVLRKTKQQLTNQSVVSTSAAHREFQAQIIQKALMAVHECDPSEKDITSMTMAIDEKNLEKARELTRKYRREMCALLEEGQQTRVYNLGIQLYPISQKEDMI